jgi:DNA (cytosine-5)-methyltransferase 3A
MMGEKWEKILSKAIGVNPIMINSSLVSAQNRKRLYWTNIGMQPMGLFGDMQSIIQQPKDKGILLKDVLESAVDEKYFLSENAIKSIILNNNNLQKSNIDPLKSNPLQSPGHACGVYKGASYTIARLNKTIENNTLIENCLIDSYNQQIHINKSITISTRVNASSCTHIYKNSRIRRLTPIECERLQTIADNYTNHVSDSQRYKMLGNGWTVSVVSHIFSYI